jgi:hypothetical protein
MAKAALKLWLYIWWWNRRYIFFSLCQSQKVKKSPVLYGIGCSWGYLYYSNLHCLLFFILS